MLQRVVLFITEAHDIHHIRKGPIYSDSTSTARTGYIFSGGVVGKQPSTKYLLPD